MASTTTDLPTRGHARNPSSDERRRIPLPRRSTKGPLDDEGARTVESPSLSSSTDTETPNITDPPRDFGYLQRPELYHPLSHLETPAPFRAPHLQPPADTPLPTLLSTGHFRAAAILSAHRLTTTPDLPFPELFSLLYARLASLSILGLSALAAQEAKALGDLSTPFYRSPSTGRHLVPWELRVLAVRLQARAHGDWRRGVVGLYELGREARAEAARTPLAEAERQAWRTRLRDLGLGVAAALVEVGDLEAAGQVLDGMSPDEPAQQAWRRTLLYLRLGDVRAAERVVSDGAREQGVLRALVAVAEGRFEDAAGLWQSLKDDEEGEGDGDATEARHELVTQNLAVCLLYTGRLNEARALLETLVDRGYAFYGLTFNLATMYELCSERSHALKIELAERVASQRDPAKAAGPMAGWDKSNADFKL